MGAIGNIGVIGEMNFFCGPRSYPLPTDNYKGTVVMDFVRGFGFGFAFGVAFMAIAAAVILPKKRSR